MSDIELAGSCLCGAVKYVVTGDPQNFFHCHCSRCRKSSGTGHASNIIMTGASLDWLSGKEQLAGYKVPDAKFFGTVFCSTCGSPMPRYSPERQVAVVPAGSLDSEPAIEPTGRIFRDSAASWSCSTDAIPEFEQYPPRS